MPVAWFLQDRGLDVTGVDRDEVGAGASWGNAGWLPPGLALPLTSPRMLGEGMRGLADPRAPLSIPLRGSPAFGPSCCDSPRIAPSDTGSGPWRTVCLCW